MAIPKMLQDRNNEELQILGFDSQLAPLSSTIAEDNTGVLDTDDATVVMLIPTEDIYIDIGVAAAAMAANFIIPASTILYFTVAAGEQVSVLRVTVDGSVRIVEMK